MSNGDADAAPREDGPALPIESARPSKPVEVGQALAAVRSRLFGAPPTAIRIARYLLLEKLGEGGIGVVYRAYDPELDRRVAIKLLQTPGRDDPAETRLAREAQAMAQVSHPNVVTVHDVGRYDLTTHGTAFAGGDEPPLRGVFVVLELLDGTDLHRWLKAETRTTARVLEVFAAAGEGLAAAHRAGLVHRDFKPSNVFLTDDGVTKVLDFGLARAHDSVDAKPAPRAATESSGDWKAPMTRDGAIVGTPAYMAPEQHRGEPADPRGDQFSFCVALVEALTGRRPFEAGSVSALADAKTRGIEASAEALGRVPPRVRRVVVRGLAPRKEDRFDDMGPLIEALRPPTRARRLWVAATLLAGAAVIAVATADDRPTAGGLQCVSNEERLAGVWDTGRRDRVRAALLDTAVSYADDAATGVVSGLDDYVDAWARARSRLCETGASRPDVEAVAAELTCLDRQLRRVDELARLLEAADASTARHAVEAVGELPSPDRCGSDTAGALPEDADERERVLAIDDELARVEALVGARRGPEAVVAARDLLRRAESLGHPRSHTKTLLLLGRAELMTGDHEAARDALFTGVTVARRNGLGHQAAACLVELAVLEGATRTRLDQAVRWAELAEVELELIDARPLDRANLGKARGVVALSRGEYPEARVALERALATTREALGDDHPRVASLMNLLAQTQQLQGEPARAREIQSHALEIATRALGAEHPSLAGHYVGLAVIEAADGDSAAAAGHYEQALGVLRGSFDDAHPDVLRVMNNLATTMMIAGRYDEALEQLTAVLRAKEAANPAGNPSTAATLNNLGAVLAELERYDEAVRHHRRALALRESMLGPDHPETAGSQVNLGAALLMMGRAEESKTHLEAGMRTMASALPPGSPQLAEPSRWLGLAKLALGDRVEAEESLRHAVALAESGGAALERGDCRFALAQLLTPGEPGRALSLAAQAEADWGERAGLDARHRRLAELRAQLAPLETGTPTGTVR